MEHTASARQPPTPLVSISTVVRITAGHAYATGVPLIHLRLQINKHLEVLDHKFEEVFTTLEEHGEDIQDLGERLPSPACFMVTELGNVIKRQFEKIATDQDVMAADLRSHVVEQRKVNTAHGKAVSVLCNELAQANTTILGLDIAPHMPLTRESRSRLLLYCCSPLGSPAPPQHTIRAQSPSPIGRADAKRHRGALDTASIRMGPLMLALSLEPDEIFKLHVASIVCLAENILIITLPLVEDTLALCCAWATHSIKSYQPIQMLIIPCNSDSSWA
ncbi:hypothetical protein B0H17DRAFT_1196310 [Mycena rosella]|uniref:Uncharacterized protein n=1 Tax=Mycena rosella TaxID=1033263 RepID=A0AAD7GKE6_MYCRO|nr:hypothetical protein B0H17DRAFT_1196310 [Mycena rosella]